MAPPQPEAAGVPAMTYYGYRYRRRSRLTPRQVAAAAGAGVVLMAFAHAHALPHGTSAAPAAVPLAPGPVSYGSGESDALRIAATYGWSGQQGTCLGWLWTRESGFDSLIRNPGGAFGVAQALGHGIPATAAYNVRYLVSEGGGWQTGTVDEYGPGYGLSVQQAREANAGDEAEQVRWGLGYIRDDYGNPCRAWGHETSSDWY
jgi:hypothetical protein